MSIHLAEEKDFEVGAWRVSPSTLLISSSSGRVRLEPRVMQVLIALSRQAGETVSRDRLVEECWSGVAVSDDAVVRSVSQLRKALANGSSEVAIVTVAKVGYRLVVAETRRPRPALVALGAAAALALVVVGFAMRPAPRPDIPLSRPLTSFPGIEQWPAVSPAGERVAYVRAGDIHVQAIGASEGVRLTDSPDRETLPVWSPDGERIAFVRQSESICGIHVVASSGGADSRIADCGQGGVISIDWSGSSLILSERESPLAPGRAFLVDANSGERSKLLEDVRASIEEVVFSPDGKRLAFSVSPSLGVEDLYIRPLTSGESTRVTRENLKIHGFDWLPDGSGFIVSSNRGGEFALWRVAIDGSEWTLVPGAIGGADEPRVSASGRMVYEVWRTESSVVRADAAGSLAPVSPSTRRDWDGELSPDGRKIAFLSDRSGSAEVWVAEASGERPVRRTSFGGAYTHSPRFSPDGRTIAFATPAEGSFDLYLVDVESGAPRRLTDGPSDDFAPAWAPDGKALYFGSTRSGEWQIWRLELASGALRPVTRDGGRVAQVSPDGRSLYFVKVDRAGLYRMALLPEGSSEECVVQDLEPVDWNNWQVLEGAIYYVRRPVPDEPELVRVDSTSKASALVRPLERLLHTSGLYVTPDETEILYTAVTGNEADLQIIGAGRF